MSLIVRSQLGLAERLGVKAMDDCGPASLATCATWLGVPTTTKQAHKACAEAGRVDTPTGAEGTSAKELAKAGKILGLNARVAYDWSEVSNQVKNGAALILNIQARQGARDWHGRWRADHPDPRLA